MENNSSSSHSMKAKKKNGEGRPLPKRGQVKARIFRGLAHAVASRAFKNGGRAKGDGSDRSSADVTPATSGYTSSFDDEDY